MKFYILFAYILIINSSVFAKKYLQFTKLECTSKPEILTITRCDVTKSDNYPNGVGNIEMDLNIKIEKFYLHLETFKLTNGEYKPYIIKFDLDVCNIMEKGKNSDSLVGQLIQRMAKKFDTNAFHKCPFEGHIYAKNMSLEMKDFAKLENLLQPGSYRVSNTYYLTEAKDVVASTVDVYTNIKEK